MEGPENNTNINGPENIEVAELLRELDEKAVEVGTELEEMDYIKIGPEKSMKVLGRIEMIFGALGVATGLKIAFDAMPSLISSPAEVDTLLHTARTVLAVGGSALFLAGFNKLAVGYKRLHGYIKVGELRNGING